MKIKENNNYNNNDYNDYNNDYNNLFCCYDLFVLTYDDLSALSNSSIISTMNCIMIFGMLTLAICCVLSICRTNQNKYKQNKTIKYNVIENENENLNESENLNGVKITPTYSTI